MRHLAFLVLALSVLPACQTQKDRIIEDQDRELAALREEQNRLARERERIRAQNQELQDALSREMQQNSELQERVATYEAQIAEADAEVEALRSRLLGTGVGVERRGDVIVLDLPAAITFPSGSAELSDQGHSSLAAVAKALQEGYAGRTLWIEGHTDSDPIRKSKWESNLHLSAARALAVANYLTKDLGIDPAMVRVAAHGEYDPVAPNDTAENKAANRRVEILILNNAN